MLGDYATTRLPHCWRGLLRKIKGARNVGATSEDEGASDDPLNERSVGWAHWYFLDFAYRKLGKLVALRIVAIF